MCCGFVALSSERIGDLLARLGLPPVKDQDDFVVTPPSYRFDIEIEEDLIEEVARLHGYENIPSPAPVGLMSMLPGVAKAKKQMKALNMDDRVIARQDTARQIDLLRDLCGTMEAGSLCAMGGLTPYPVRSALDHFAEDFS